LKSKDEAARGNLDAAAQDFEQALRAVPDGPADEMLREAMRQMIVVAHRHEDTLEQLFIDPAANTSMAMGSLTGRLLDPAMALLARLKATDELRPVADMILARTFLALFLGMVASERAVPQVARIAMRIFPERVWVDGMVDLLLYGVLEDKAR
jgi:hypothetical protein